MKGETSIGRTCNLSYVGVRCGQRWHGRIGKAEQAHGGLSERFPSRASSWDNLIDAPYKFDAHFGVYDKDGFEFRIQKKLFMGYAFHVRVVSYPPRRTNSNERPPQVECQFVIAPAAPRKQGWMSSE